MNPFGTDIRQVLALHCWLLSQAFSGPAKAEIRHQFPRPNFSRTLLLLPIVFLTLSSALADEVPAVNEPEAAVAEISQEPPAILKPNDSDFHDQPIHCRVAWRFEMYNPHSIDHLKDIQSMGFQQVILDWPNLHADATRLGLDVVIANWWTQDTEVREIEERIELLKGMDKQRLRAISMMDEPERNAPDTPFSFYQSLYGDLRKHFDTEHPELQLELSHWGPLRRWEDAHYEVFTELYQSADRMRVMPYPDLGEGPLSEVSYQMLRSRHLMKLAGREIPQIVILQTWVLPEEPKLPEIRELRVMIWQALLMGADVVSFFSYEPDTWKKTPGFTEGFRDLMQELSVFGKEFRGSMAETRINSAGILTSQLITSNHQRVTIQVNTSRQAAADLPGLAVRFIRSVPPSLNASLNSGGVACIADSPRQSPARHESHRARRRNKN